VAQRWGRRLSASGCRTALVTGGAGLVGSELVRSLESAGWSTRVLDNMSSPNARRPSSPTTVFVEGSVTDPETVATLAEGCAVIVHLAEVVGVRRVLDDPLGTFQASVEGIRAVCTAADRHGSSVVYTSSSEVYGIDAVPPLSEGAPAMLTHLPSGRAMYAMAKIVCEEYLLTWMDRGLRNVSIARLFNTCGPSQSVGSGMVLPRMVQSAVDGRPIQVFGDGRQTRTFLHVTDCADALMRIVVEVESPTVSGNIFNIGGTREIGMMDLAILIRERLGSRSRIEVLPYSKAYGTSYVDTMRRVPRTDKLREILSWTPAIELDRIIDELGFAADA
jgi:UDP-glucose 4-epimerase